MADFTSGFWGIYITVLTIVSVFGCAWLLWSQSTIKTSVSKDGHVETTGHSWDEGLEELNNPMPRWWMWLFYITIVFGLAYLFLYPGLGTYAGKLGWASKSQYEEELKLADEEYGPLFAKYQQVDMKTPAADPIKAAVGKEKFAACAACHGADGKGNTAMGAPNLTDKTWLYGGSVTTIMETIRGGRNNVMPAFAEFLGEAKVHVLSAYVWGLSNNSTLPAASK